MLAIRADLLDFTDTPSWCSTDTDGVRFRPNHWLLVGTDGRILGAQVQDPGPAFEQHDHSGKLLTPGFIDTHVHSPQMDVVASHGKGLLDWLATYTFPAELRYADPAVATAGAALFLDALLAHGTTAAVVFPTVHAQATDALFAAASQRNMRVIAGKVLMNRHAPPALCDDVEQACKDCTQLIERWHGQGRNAYAVTVRFAITSTPEQLALAGELCTQHPGVYLQTHVAETQDEVQQVAQLFPQARSYLDVYHQHGLLHPRAVLAHGIWLDAHDRALLRDTGAQIAFCPSSNLFLGSGLFNWQAAINSGHRVSLASDVGGGTSLSLLRTAAEAYKVQALRGTQISAWTALHAATLGAAQSLGLADEMGHLGPGAMADVVLWHWAQGPLAQRRDAVALQHTQELHSRVFAWMMLGDEHNVVSTYLAGKAQGKTPRVAEQTVQHHA
jgi:guanine deaminase